MNFILQYAILGIIAFLYIDWLSGSDITLEKLLNVLSWFIAILTAIYFILWLSNINIQELTNIIKLTNIGYVIYLIIRHIHGIPDIILFHGKEE